MNNMDINDVPSVRKMREVRLTVCCSNENDTSEISIIHQLTSETILPNTAVQL